MSRLRLRVISLGLFVISLLLAPCIITAATPGVVPPELVGNSWFNVPKGMDVSLSARRGKVTVVHFWTFGCINCQRNLPAYSNWRKRFGGRGLEIIGVHTPETEPERDAGNVAKKVKELGIEYPVLLDPSAENWRRWQQRVWPAVYLIDKQGRVRFAWEGELEYQGAGGDAKISAMIEQLLRE